MASDRVRLELENLHSRAPLSLANAMAMGAGTNLWIVDEP
jgi:hypothetical protein